MKLLVLIVFVLHSAVLLAEDKAAIHVATDSWEGYTNPDGSGLYFDMLRLVYESSGIDLNYTITPYKRSVLLVTSKLFDAWIASYENEKPNVIYPKIILDYDDVVALYKKKRFPDWKGEHSLKDKRLAWIRGYGYEDYLKVNTNWRELNERGPVISMLELDRVDAFLDHIEDVDALVEKSAIDMNAYQTGLVFRLDLYMGFADTERGRALADLWDNRMQALIASGELSALWKKWTKKDFPFARYDAKSK